MTNQEIISTLKRNSEANPNRPKFQESCTAAITAISENEQLKNRCFALAGGGLCLFCEMNCKHNPRMEYR